MTSKLDVIFPWVIKKENAEAIISDGVNLDVGNVILNSVEFPYINNVLHEVIRFSEINFTIPVYSQDQNYNNKILEILNNANKCLVEQKIENLKFKMIDLPNKEQHDNFIKLGSLIDKFKVYCLDHYLNLQNSTDSRLICMDFDYAYKHNDEQLFQKEIVLFNGRYDPSYNDFTPQIFSMKINDKSKEFLKDVIAIHEQCTEKFFDIHSYFKLSLLKNIGTLNDFEIKEMISKLKDSRKIYGDIYTKNGKGELDELYSKIDNKEINILQIEDFGTLIAGGTWCNDIKENLKKPMLFQEEISDILNGICIQMMFLEKVKS